MSSSIQYFSLLKKKICNFCVFFKFFPKIFTLELFKIVEIARTAELSFRKHTKTSKSSMLPVDKVVEDVQTSSFAKSLWNNIVDQCELEVSKECQSLCFENIVKLYSTATAVCWNPS